MPNVQPIQQPPIEDIRNALQVAELRAHERLTGAPDVRNAFAAIAVLLHHAIEGLSEPSLAAMQAGEVLLREWSGTPEPQRQLWDTLSGILRAQVTGEIPKTWEVS